jgi:succinate-acetate transporter protein
MVNANAVNAGVAPVVYSVALMFGGGVQLIAAIILLRTGNTLTGVIFGGFAGFYLSLFALAQWFLKDVPAAQAGHALGLFLYAFGIFAFVLLAGSLRTNAVLVLTLALAVILVFFLAAGHYGANTTLIHWGGYLGIAAAACLFYTALSDLCEIAYGRVVFPVWSLAKR